MGTSNDPFVPMLCTTMDTLGHHTTSCKKGGDVAIWRNKLGCFCRVLPPGLPGEMSSSLRYQKNGINLAPLFMIEKEPNFTGFDLTMSSLLSAT